VYNCLYGTIKKPIKIDHSNHIPTLSETSLKVLFRTLKISAIIDVIRNLLYEKGIFIIGSNRKVGFHVIEALSSLIFPFKWNFAKITSFALNYDLFVSPIPLIYFIAVNSFKLAKIRSKDLSDKCIVHLQGSTIEYCVSNTPELPKKAFKVLQERLEKSTGEYNRLYLT